jgi:hypothetical protein
LNTCLEIGECKLAITQIVIDLYCLHQNLLLLSQHQLSWKVELILVLGDWKLERNAIFMIEPTFSWRSLAHQFLHAMHWYSDLADHIDFDFVDSTNDNAIAAINIKNLCCLCISHSESSKPVTTKL